MIGYLKLFTIALTVLLFVNESFAQEHTSDCRVLLSSISGQYDGDCKDGFAHGRGISKGIDIYKGKFKSGLPHGSGVYTWKSGNKYTGSWKKGRRNGVGTLYSASNEESIKGQWRDDEFIREIEDAKYKVTFKKDIVRYSFEKLDESSTDIEIVIMRNGVVYRNPSSLELSSSFGNSNITGSYMGFENTVYPFEGYIRFSAPGLYNNTMYDHEMRFKILEEGNWKIRITFN